MTELVEIDPAGLPTDTVFDREGPGLGMPPEATEMMKAVILSIRPASRRHAVASIAPLPCQSHGKAGCIRQFQQPLIRRPADF